MPGNVKKSNKHKRQASAKSGMLPGSAVYVGENPPQASKVVIHIYDAQSYQKLDSFQLDEVNKALAEGKSVWVDVAGLADSENITALCAAFDVHPLIIEDILNTRQRPKLDIFDHYLFIVFKLLDAPTHRLTYNAEQFSLIVRKNLLLTFRETENYSLAPLYQRLNMEYSLMREHGSDYLAYLVMDSIVDNYFNFVEQSTEMLEKMEDLLISDPEEISLQELYTIKRRTLTLRKTIAPLRDIVHLLLGEHNKLIDSKYHLYYRDLHDHCIRLLESVDLHREMTVGMLDIYLSTLNNRMNETMKVLTLFASIFIPLTFIVGVYGMNFKFMPELAWYYGYPAVLTGMTLLVMAMLYYFRRKKLI